jgi:hypothetical protein
MAGERTLPGIGLRAFWTAGSSGYNDELDPDLRMLSVLTQAAAISRGTNLPGTPANGDIYIIPEGQTNANQIAARDNGAWVLYAPREGWLVHVNDEDAYVRWTGTEWEVLQSAAMTAAEIEAALDTYYGSADWRTPGTGGSMTAAEIEAALDTYYGSADWRTPGTGGSMTAAEIEAALDTYYGNTDWRTGGTGSMTAAQIEAALDTYYGNTDWRTGGGGTLYYALSSFYNQSDSTVVSSSAYATKGSIFTLTEPRVVAQVEGFFSGTQTVKLVIAKLSEINPGTITEIMYDGTPVPLTASNSVEVFDVPNVVLEAGIYAFLWVRTDGSATSVIATAFPTEVMPDDPDGFWEFEGTVRYASNNPSVNDSTFYNTTSLVRVAIKSFNKEGYVGIQGPAGPEGPEGPPGAGSSVGNPGYRYWRLNILDNNGSTDYIAVCGLKFLDADDVDLSVPANAFASSVAANPAVSPDKAFVEWFSDDGNSGSYWSSDLDPVYPVSLGFDGGSGAALKPVKVTMTGVRDATRVPESFDVQYSEDGTNWATLTRVSGQTGWALGGTDTRTFYLNSLPDISAVPDAPSDGVNYVRKNGEWVQESGSPEAAVAPHGSAMLAPSTDQTYTIYSVFTPLTFDAVVRDTDGLVDPAEPHGFTIPTGVTKIRLKAAIKTDANASFQAASIAFSKNGDTEAVSGLAGETAKSGGYTNYTMNLSSGILEVVPGDVFKLELYTGSQFNVNAARNSTWFEIEVVERTLSSVGLNFDFGDLSDVDMTTPPADGEVAIWSEANQKWMPGTPIVATPVGSSVQKPFMGAMAKLSGDKNITAPSEPFPWDVTEYDTDAFWSAGTPGSFTVPAGVSMVQLFAFLEFANGSFSSSNVVFLGIKKNGVDYVVAHSGQPGYADSPIAVASPPIKVVEGDYFEIRWNTSNTGSLVVETGSSFAIQVLETYEVV